jgi:hypothetical protein
MNQTLKHSLHVVGLALGTALLMGCWDILSAVMGVIIPALKSGVYPHLADIKNVLIPSTAKALGSSAESFMTVAALYAAKIKFLGSSKKSTIQEEVK